MRTARFLSGCAIVLALGTVFPMAASLNVATGDTLAVTLGNEIWKLSVNDTTGGTGEFFVAPPAGGSLWGVGADNDRNVYFIYEQASNHVIAQVTASGAVQTLATLPLAGSQFFVADYEVAPSGNNYILFRNQANANAWVARVGMDGNAIDVQNGQGISGPFTTPPVNAGFGGSLAINNQERVLVLASKLGDDLLYDVRVGTPLVALGVLNVGDIEFANDQLWALRQAGNNILRNELLQVTLPAAPQTGPLAVQSRGVYDTFAVAKEGSEASIILFGLQQLRTVNLETFAVVSTRPFREAQGAGGLSPRNFAVVPANAMQPPAPSPSSNADLYSSNPSVGIYATASRGKIRVLRGDRAETDFGSFIQVSRLGLPLINEAVVGLQNPPPTTDDPIISSTGEFVHDAIDLILGGPLPLLFTRHYGGLIGIAAEARGFYPAADAAMGVNWLHNFQILIRKISATEVAVFYLQGSTIRFTKSASAWTMSQQGLSFKGTPYQLLESGTKLRMLDPATRLMVGFDIGGLADGGVRGVETISDRNGNTHSIGYNSDGTVKSVDDGLGRRLDFTYIISAGKPRLSQVADQGGRKIQFGYTDGRLATSTDAREKTTTYSYNATGQLESIRLPGGNTPVRNTYDSSSRVIDQTDGAGNITRLAYNPGNTVITDAAGATRTHHFDSQLRWVRNTDEAGKPAQFAYDGSHRRLATTNRRGDSVAIGYDAASGKIKSLADYTGKAWSYSYVAQQQDGFTFFNLSRIDYPDGTHDELTYDARGNFIGMRDRGGKTWANTYDSRGQVLSETNPDGGVARYTYNSDGTLASATDAAGNTTSFSYDVFKRPIRTDRADNTVIRQSYDPNDNLLTRTNPKGRTVSYSYDDNNNLKSFADPLGKTWTFAYNGNEQLTGITDPGGKTATSTYDALRRLSSATDRNGNVTRYSYDSRSRLTSVTDAAGKIWSFTYDDDGIVTSMRNPLGATWQFSPDKIGRISSMTDPLSNQSRREFDPLSRVVSATNPLAEATTFTYDERGLLVGAAEPQAITATYTRNNLGLITRIVDPRGKVRTRSYDTMGKLSASSDALGNMTRLSYDERSRPARVDLPLGTLDVTYDEIGLPASIAFSEGTRFDYRFDEDDRLTSASGAAFAYDDNDRLVSSNGIAITRDAGGRITAVTLAAGKTARYGYDSRNLLTDITDWAGGIVRFVYDDAGRLTSMTRPNGIVSIYTYDAADRLTGIVERRGAQTLSSIGLTLDGKGQTRQAERQTPLPATSSDPNQATRSVNDADQITGFTYDAMGRLANDGRRTYKWDLASRLASYTDGGVTVEFSYDAFGNRTGRTTAGKTQTYVWNYALGLPSISIIRNGSGDLRYYVHTPDGALIYSLEAADNRRRFHHHDEVGSTLFVSDDSGAITDTYAYSPYGQLTGSSGTTDNPFTYIGRYGVMLEATTGLYYMRARYYDGSTGRFISRDPLDFDPYEPKSLNAYQYAFENPLAFIDPQGTEEIAGGVGGGFYDTFVGDTAIRYYSLQRFGGRISSATSSQHVAPIDLAFDPVYDIDLGQRAEWSSGSPTYSFPYLRVDFTTLRSVGDAAPLMLGTGKTTGPHVASASEAIAYPNLLNLNIAYKLLSQPLGSSSGGFAFELSPAVNNTPSTTMLPPRRDTAGVRLRF